MVMSESSRTQQEHCRSTENTAEGQTTTCDYIRQCYNNEDNKDDDGGFVSVCTKYLLPLHCVLN